MNLDPSQCKIKNPVAQSVASTTFPVCKHCKYNQSHHANIYPNTYTLKRDTHKYQVCRECMHCKPHYFPEYKKFICTFWTLSSSEQQNKKSTKADASANHIQTKSKKRDTQTNQWSARGLAESTGKSSIQVHLV
jgi:hypothetical protein